MLAQEIGGRTAPFGQQLVVFQVIRPGLHLKIGGLHAAVVDVDRALLVGRIAVEGHHLRFQQGLQQRLDVFQQIADGAA